MTLKKSNGVVYFIKSHDKIKIGITTSDLDTRLKALWGSSPVKCEVLGVIFCENPSKLEGELHRRFNRLWSHAEWFNTDKSITDYIRINAKPYNFEFSAGNQNITALKYRRDTYEAV